MHDSQDLIKPDIHSASSEYRDRFAGKVGEWFLDAQNNITASLLNDHQQGELMIDFGGGHGQNIQVAQKLGLKVSILSSDPVCNELIQQEHNDIDYRLGLLTKSDLPAQSYHAVLSYRMLPHLENWQTHIQELCRVSKKTVLVEFPNAKSVNALSDKLFKLKKKVEGNTRQFTLFNLQQVNSEFTKHGFQLVEARGQYCWPMVLHRAIKNTPLSKMLESAIGVILPRNTFGSPLICKFVRTDTHTQS